MDYFDILLAKKLSGGGGGNITVEPITITENGTTTAPTGKAFSPIYTDVPLPENAYLLNDIEDLPKDIATFTDGSALPMPSLKTTIVPIQEGSGTPSPTNIRPISGWSGVNVTVSPLNISQLYNGQIYGDGSWVSSNMRLTNVTEAQDNSYFLKAGTYTLDYDKLNSNAPNLLQCSALTKDGNYTIIDNFANEWNSVPFTFTLTQDGYFYFTIRKDADTNINPSDYRAKILGNTYTIQFTDGSNPLVVYGGSLDVVSGVLTLTHEIADLPSLGWGKSTNTANIYFYVLYTSGANGTYNEPATNVISNIYIPKSRTSLTNIQGTVGISAEAKALYIADERFNDYTVAQFKEAVGDVQLLLPLATPQTIQLTPTQVKSLLGSNNVWCDTGDIIELSYFSKPSEE